MLAPEIDSAHARVSTPPANGSIHALRSAAVDPQVCPVDEAGERADEECHGVRNVIDASDPSNRVREDLLHDPLLGLRQIVTPAASARDPASPLNPACSHDRADVTVFTVIPLLASSFARLTVMLITAAFAAL